jgi:hypothetical protein
MCLAVRVYGITLVRLQSHTEAQCKVEQSEAMTALRMEIDSTDVHCANVARESRASRPDKLIRILCGRDAVTVGGLELWAVRRAVNICENLGAQSILQLLSRLNGVQSIIDGSLYNIIKNFLYQTYNK